VQQDAAIYGQYYNWEDLLDSSSACEETSYLNDVEKFGLEYAIMRRY
jgi:hypothetical protein